MAKKHYVTPSAEVAVIQVQSGLLAGSGKAKLGGSLGGWNDEGGHAWDETSPSGGGGSSVGGWTDSGGNAWE